MSGTYLPGEPVNTSATWKGWDREALDLTSTRHGELVFRRQFVHTENCDDVAQFLVLLQRFLNAAGDRVVFFADDVGVDLTGRGVERVNGRVDTRAAMSRLNTTVASKWLKVVAGDGSVKSSAGTYTA